MISHINSHDIVASLGGWCSSACWCPWGSSPWPPSRWPQSPGAWPPWAASWHLGRHGAAVKHGENQGVPWPWRYIAHSWIVINYYKCLFDGRSQNGWWFRGIHGSLFQDTCTWDALMHHFMCLRCPKISEPPRVMHKNWAWLVESLRFRSL